MSYFLSICIPTYNGGENLKYNVNKLIKMQPEFGFEVCISDNASDDDTQEFMEDIIGKYDFVRYHRNEENLGFAYNFDYVLNMANGKYRWLLGDDDEIVEENLGKVISSLKEYKPDVCVVNGGEKTEQLRVNNIKMQIFKDKNNVLSNIGEHMSWISSLIFNKNVINKIKIVNIKDNAFPHLIETFKYLNKNCNLLWMPDNCVMIQQNCQKRYSEHFLEYFIKDWCSIIDLIGNYDNLAKSAFCQAEERRAFGVKSIFGLRARNLITRQNIKLCNKQLQKFSIKTQILIKMVNCLPVRFVKFIRFVYKMCKL